MRKRARLSGLCAFLAFALGLLSCGSQTTSSGGPFVCGAFDCGGNVVGTWTVSGACYDLTGIDPTGGQCPSATVTPSVEASGTLQVDAGGTYHYELSVSGSVAVNFPASCTESNLMSCSQLDNALRQITCTGTPSSGCTCSLPVTALTQTEDGTWTTNGSQFLTEPTTPGAMPGNHSYCVQGNTWTLHQDGDPANSQPGTTLVATHQ